MQIYELYLADVCSCDSDWLFLGKVEAESQSQAEEQAIPAWHDGLIVCIPVVRKEEEAAFSLES